MREIGEEGKMAVHKQLDLFGNVIKKHSAKMACLGVTNKTCMDRSPLDYYGTDPRAVEALLVRETFAHRVWEPTSGHGNIADVLKAHVHEVTSTDIKDYGRQDYKQDFLLAGKMPKEGPMDILMNPPYKLAKEFVRHAIDLLESGSKMGALLRIQFLEGKARYDEIHAGDPPCGCTCSQEGLVVRPGMSSARGRTTPCASAGLYGRKAIRGSRA